MVPRSGKIKWDDLKKIENVPLVRGKGPLRMRWVWRLKKSGAGDRDRAA